MTHSKTEDDWNVLINEYSVCKKKLQSKREALKILVKDLEQCQVERDIYKNKICQMQQELNELKDLLGGYWRGKKNGGVEEDHNKKIKVLKQLLEHVREENQALHNDMKSVKQLYVDSQNDNQLLREAISKHESQQKVNNIQTQDKARLIDQLEETQNKIDGLQRELQAVNDEKCELVQERDYFKEKANRLNTELNYVLYNDEKRIVDVDALILENKYLKEVTKQYKEEKLLAVATSLRYKEALEQRKDKASKFLAYLDLPNNFKTDGNVANNTSKSHQRLRLGSNSETVTELQRVAKSLTEMLSEKDIALKHQRNTNRHQSERIREEIENSGDLGAMVVAGQNAGKNRKMELRLEEHMRQNSLENQNGDHGIASESDGDPKSPTLCTLSEDEATENNNIAQVKEGVLLDINSKRQSFSSDLKLPSDLEYNADLDLVDNGTEGKPDEVAEEKESEEFDTPNLRQSSSCPVTPLK